MNDEDRPLNKDELDQLPFDFKDAYYAKPDSTNTQYYFAKWHGRLAYSTDLIKVGFTKTTTWTSLLNSGKTTIPDFNTSTTDGSPHIFAALTKGNLSVGPAPRITGNT
jgi:hypothetical protein